MVIEPVACPSWLHLSNDTIMHSAYFCFYGRKESYIFISFYEKLKFSLQRKIIFVLRFLSGKVCINDRRVNNVDNHYTFPLYREILTSHELTPNAA